MQFSLRSLMIYLVAVVSLLALFRSVSAIILCVGLSLLLLVVADSRKSGKGCWNVLPVMGMLLVGIALMLPPLEAVTSHRTPYFGCGYAALVLCHN